MPFLFMHYRSLLHEDEKENKIQQSEDMHKKE